MKQSNHLIICAFLEKNSRDVNLKTRVSHDADKHIIFNSSTHVEQCAIKLYSENKFPTLTQL